MKSICVLFAVIAVSRVAADGGPDHGWGDNIDWKTLTDAKTESDASGKPIMLIIHKSWCGACKALKPKFGASPEVAKLAEKFVMVNVEDDEEPEGAEYSPDGGYIPRILYIKNGEVQKDVYNTGGSDKYKYFYSNADAVVAGMENAVKVFESV